MKNKITLLLLSLFFAVNMVHPATPGHQLFTFPFSTRSSAMGGTRAVDPASGLDMNGNPASTTFSNSIQGQLGFVNHLVGIQGFAASGSIPSARHTFSSQFIYFDYGLFDKTDVFGANLGTFGYHELAIAFGYGFRFTEMIRFGGRLGRFHREADGRSMADHYFDAGLIYHNEEDSLSVGLSLNAMPLGESHESYPSELRLGTSKILSHLPLRLNLEAAYGLNSDLGFAVGGEIFVHPQFRVRLGFNSNRFDLQTGVTAGDFVAGLTAGLAMDFKGLALEMAGQSFGSAGWVNQLSLGYRF